MFYTGLDAEKLKEDAARQGDGRSVSHLLNHLIQAVPDPTTGRSLGSADIAERSNGRLSRERVDAIRTRTANGISMSDLLVFCDVFDVDADYWHVQADLSELDPQVRQARETFASRQTYGPGSLREDLSSLLDSPDNTWTPDSIERHLRGELTATYIEDIASGVVRRPDPSAIRTLAVEVLGYPPGVWTERYFGPQSINNLVR